VSRSLYDVLGVSRAAGRDEVRRAYVERAREAHPDRHIDASSADRAAAERRMQDVNEAWHVLGNPRRRRKYDLETQPETQFVSRADGTMPAEIVFAEEDATTRLVKGLPWLVLVVIMFAIFVFTAYAATGGGGAAGTCVKSDGTTVTNVACDTPDARRVLSTVDVAQPCPPGTERLQPPTGRIAYCLEV